MTIQISIKLNLEIVLLRISCVVVRASMSICMSKIFAQEILFLGSEGMQINIFGFYISAVITVTSFG